MKFECAMSKANREAGAADGAGVFPRPSILRHFPHLKTGVDTLLVLEGDKAKASSLDRLDLDYWAELPGG